MFAVTRSYGLDRSEPTVTFTLLSISHQPSLVDDPVTASRTVRRRGTDYTRLAAVFRHGRRHHQRGRRGVAGGGLPAARGDPPQPSPVSGLGADGGRRAAGRLGLRAGRRWVPGVHGGGGGARDARRPAGVVVRRARAAGVLPVHGGRDAARRDGGGADADPFDGRPPVRGDHRWAVRAAAGAGAGGGGAGRADRLLHHRLGPAARSHVLLHRDRRGRADRPLSGAPAGAQLSPRPGSRRTTNRWSRSWRRWR